MPTDAQIRTALDTLGTHQLAAHECFGGAAAVLRDGEVICESYFGGDRFSDRALFRLASMTKLFTAAAVMKLAEDGRLNIEAPVSTYLPAFAHLKIGTLTADGSVRAASMPRREITPFDLLTHTAGLGADTLGNREYDLMPPVEKVSLARVVDRYGASFHLAFEPGSRAAYSGFAGYDVLARIIELVTGMSFGAYLKAAFFDPLGMPDTTFAPTPEQYARFSPVQKRVRGEEIAVNFRGEVFRGIPTTYEAAGAALASTLPDLVRFFRMLARGGELDGVRVLRPESVRCMIAPKLPDNLPGLLPGENNAFGCFVVTGAHRLPRGSVYTHGAYGTHALFLPRENLVGILLKNSYVDMSLTSHATLEFEKALLGKSGT